MKFEKAITENIQIGKTIKEREYVLWIFQTNMMDYIPSSIIYGITGQNV
jgi:hypothetical protein